MNAPTLYLPTQHITDIMRAAVADAFGVALATKSSEQMCQHLYTRLLPSAEAATLKDAQFSVVLGIVPSPRRGVRLGHRIHVAGQMPRTLGEVRTERARRAKQLREEFEARVKPIRAEVEAAARQEGVERGIESDWPSTELAWVNSSMLTRNGMRGLAEIAHDDCVQVIDLPPAIRAEMRHCSPTIGVSRLRTRHPDCHTGQGVRIAVCDYAMALDHPALAGRVVNSGNYTDELEWRPHDHATMIAGIIASDDSGYPGVAPEAEILAYKVIPDDNTLSDRQGFGFTKAFGDILAQGDVDVINCSFGLGPAPRPGSSLWAEAFNMAWELGVPVVKSAGNGGPEASTLTHPAEAQGAIVVGATDADGERVATYSSRGPLSSGPRRPDFVAPGGSEDGMIEGCLANGEFGWITGGTSFAAAYVSGILGLLTAANPDSTLEQRRDIIAAACTGLQEDECAQGAGRVNLDGLF